MRKKITFKLAIIFVSFGIILSGAGLFLLAYILNPLVKIEVKNLPAKTVYYETEEFDSTGLEVMAEYRFYNAEKTVTDFAISVNSPLTVETNLVTISYTEDDITTTTTFPIIVKPRVISDMVVLTMPTKTNYFVGEFFDLQGLKLQTNCEGNNAASFEPKDIQISKQNVPLQTSDEEIIIAYTERDKTVFVQIPITVTEITTELQEVQVAESLLEFLPSINDVDLNDADTVEYIETLISNLTPQQKAQIVNIEALQEITEKLAELQVQKDAELNMEYVISYSLKALSGTFQPNNATTYKNVQGVVVLNDATSTQLYESGYVFSHWENSIGQSISSIQNITSNTTYYAVFKLSSTIVLKIVNNNDDFVIGELEITRFNGTEFKYNLLSSEVNNFVFDATNCLPTEFYRNGLTVTSLNTATGRMIKIEVQIASPQQVVEENVPTPQAESIMLVYGDNVQEFILSDGYLTENDLSTIYSLYNEQNERYLNYYIVSGVSKIYSELSTINFHNETSRIVIVRQIENKFNITIAYSGGQKIFRDLVGKQTIQSALNSYVNNDEETQVLVNGLFENFNTEQILAANFVFTMPLRSEFDLILHDGNETSTISVPDYTTENYALTQNLPSKQKLGYLFLGWAITADDSTLTNEFLNTVVQNKNRLSDLYAKWAVNSNYDFPQNSANYDEVFVGEWTATFEHDNKVFDVSLNLNSDGFYDYVITVNGMLNADMIGEYRYENSKISIYSANVDGDYQLISKNDFTIDITFADDFMLIAKCFYIAKLDSASSIEFFDVVLQKQNIKFANYYGENFLGTYAIEISNILTNATDNYIIQLLNNGRIIITKNGVSQIATYRASDNKMFLLSNGFIGVKDITEFITKANRV